MEYHVNPLYDFIYDIDCVAGRLAAGSWEMFSVGMVYATSIGDLLC